MKFGKLGAQTVTQTALTLAAACSVIQRIVSTPKKVRTTTHGWS